MDYRRYVDGKARIAGVLSFLAARGTTIPIGAPGDRAEQETAHGLGRRKDRYFAELLAHEGVHVFDSAPLLLQDRPQVRRAHGDSFIQPSLRGISALCRLDGALRCTR
jgi:hypothetical protein